MAKDQKNKKKKQKWIKFRHRIIWGAAYCFLYPYTLWKYRVKIKKYKEKKKRPMVVLFNHQTGLDQFVVGAGFQGPVYFVASEDLFSNGKISRLLEWAIAPIPIKKQATDARAVLNCMRVMKEGGTIALSPEGNRTFSGKTEYINPAIAGLARAMKLPIIFYRLEGGYGIQPRWSDVVRKGKMRSYVSRIMEPSEYASLSDAEFAEVIRKELWQNECETGGSFHHKQLAQYIERAYYVCPCCGLSTFQSKGSEFWCERCGVKARYTPEKKLVALQGDFPFDTTVEWYDYQTQFIKGLDLTAHEDTPMYREQASMYEVTLYKHKKLVYAGAELALYGNKISVLAGDNSLDLPFTDVRAVTVLGRNKLNIYFGDRVLQFKGDKRFNAVKYVQIFHHFKNVEKGDLDGFLGL